jgi:hypothetical protein
MKLVIFTPFFCSSTGCFPPDAAASRGRILLFGHRSGHHDHVLSIEATSNDSTSSKLHRLECYLGSVNMALAMRRRGQRPRHHLETKIQRHHDQITATHKELSRGKRPGHHDQIPVTSNRLAATIKYLRGCSCGNWRYPPCAADIGLGKTIKYRSQCLCVLNIIFNIDK